MAPRTSLMNSGSMIEESVSAGQDQVPEPVAGQQAGLPPAEPYRLAAAEGGQPAEPHGEDGDEEDPGEKNRNRDAEHAQAQNEPRAKRAGAHRAIDPGRQGEQEHDQARAEHQLEAGGKFGQNDLERRPLVDDGGAEIALRRAAEIAHELHRPGGIEPKLVTQLLTLGFGHRFAHDLAQRVAERRRGRQKR